MMGMSVEFAYPMETSEKLQATENKDKTVVDSVEARREKANELIDVKTEGFYKNTERFFKIFGQEKQLFTSAREKGLNNPDLDARVSKLEEKVKIMENMQNGLEGSIKGDPQLLALLDSGSINYNPDAMGKEVFVPEGARLEMTA